MKTYYFYGRDWKEAVANVLFVAAIFLLIRGFWSNPTSNSFLFLATVDFIFSQIFTLFSVTAGIQRKKHSKILLFLFAVVLVWQIMLL